MKTYRAYLNSLTWLTVVGIIFMVLCFNNQVSEWCGDSTLDQAHCATQR